MGTLREISKAAFLAIGAPVLLLALFALAAIEGDLTRAALPETPSFPTQTLDLPAVERTPTSAAALPSPTAVIKARCEIPADWQAYTAKSGDTLERLADKRGVSTDTLLAGNCLDSIALKRGTTIYLPQAATLTPQPAVGSAVPGGVCTQPQGWETYIVQAGDTLFGLSSERGIALSEAQFANCLGADAVLYAGQTIFLPPSATTPTAATP
mgnify:CR=1 FL=1